MKIDLTYVPNENEMSIAKSWILSTLNHPTLGYSQLPLALQNKICLIINGQPYLVHRGPWSLSFPFIYYGGESANLTVLERFALVVSYTAAMGLSSNHDIIESIAKRLSDIILENIGTVYQQLLRSVKPIQELAINPASSHVAAKIEGQWILPNGQPIQVDSTWVHMSI